MRYLYIFDSHQFSSQCGVGTYVKELLKLVSPWEGMAAYRVMFNTQAEKAMVCTCKGTDYILMPRTIHGDPFECEDDFLSLFASFIEEEENSIFLYNYIPCEKFLRKTKAHFPKAKHLCVVHDLNWTSHLQGDDKKLRKILAREDSKNFIEAKVKDLYQREKDQFELADWIVCLSEDTLRVLREVYRISDEKITLIPNGFVTGKRRMSGQARSKCRQRYHLGEQEKVFLSVGRIGKAKGVFAFLNAFKEILKKEPDCRWVIAGEVGRAADLLPCAQEAVTRITLVGYVGKAELAEWYQMADIGIVASYTEQCSYAGLEMMSYGLPVVASDGFGVRCMFQDGVNAYVASIGKREKPRHFEQNLREEVLRLWNDKAGQKKLRSNGYRILRERYSYAQMEKLYRSVFDRLFSASLDN